MHLGRSQAGLKDRISQPISSSIRYYQIYISDIRYYQILSFDILYFGGKLPWDSTWETPPHSKVNILWGSGIFLSFPPTTCKWEVQTSKGVEILIPICKRHASMTWRRQCASMISWLTKSCKYVGGAVERGVEFKVYQEYLIDCSAYQFSRWLDHFNRSNRYQTFFSKWKIWDFLKWL